MPISEKTRKVLWGRSGNKCAVCRQELVLDATSKNGDSVVGDECHIVSGKSGGPRYDSAYSPDRADEPENLLLLCRVHHKMVDDRQETYTVDVLRGLKANHERWVSSALNDSKSLSPIRIRRIKENIPTYLARLTSGRELMAIVGGSCGYSFEHDDLQTEAEVELVGAFLQELQDWGDLSPDLEADGRVRAAFRTTTLLKELEDAGFWVFGAREDQRLEGGVGPPSPFPVAVVRVARQSIPDIIKVDLQDNRDKEPEGEKG